MAGAVIGEGGPDLVPVDRLYNNLNIAASIHLITVQLAPSGPTVNAASYILNRTGTGILSPAATAR